MCPGRVVDTRPATEDSPPVAGAGSAKGAGKKSKAGNYKKMNESRSKELPASSATTKMNTSAPKKSELVCGFDTTLKGLALLQDKFDCDLRNIECHFKATAVPCVKNLAPVVDKPAFSWYRQGCARASPETQQQYKEIIVAAFKVPEMLEGEVYFMVRVELENGTEALWKLSRVMFEIPELSRAE
eukprot:g7066.t1